MEQFNNIYNDWVLESGSTDTKVWFGLLFDDEILLDILTCNMAHTNSLRPVVSFFFNR